MYLSTVDVSVLVALTQLYSCAARSLIVVLWSLRFTICAQYVFVCRAIARALGHHDVPCACRVLRSSPSKVAVRYRAPGQGIQVIRAFSAAMPGAGLVSRILQLQCRAVALSTVNARFSQSQCKRSSAVGCTGFLAALVTQRAPLVDLQTETVVAHEHVRLAGIQVSPSRPA
jgi:hypothetical protein